MYFTFMNVQRGQDEKGARENPESQVIVINKVAELTCLQLMYS